MTYRLYSVDLGMCFFFFSSRRRHTRCALVTGVQTGALPISLVDEYERKRWPVDKLYPVEAIEAAMEAEGRTRADLASLIGQSRATEVLARKRGLTLHMIRKIERAWHVPASILVREYQLSR